MYSYIPAMVPVTVLEGATPVDKPVTPAPGSSCVVLISRALLL